LSENETAIFENEIWQIVPDYRGKIYSKNDSRIVNIIINLNELVPPEWSIIPPPDNEKKYVLINSIWQEYQKTDAEIIVEYGKAMEEYLKSVRFQRGYTTREPSDYVSSTVERWRQDAIDWIAFRDLVLLYAISVEDSVKNNRILPSLAEFISNMPKIIWTFE
jgi:hypothetical protein